MCRYLFHRALPHAMFNLTAAGPGAPGQGQDNMWLSHFIYQQAARPQLVPNPAPLVRPATNTFFVPRPGADQSKSRCLCMAGCVCVGG